MLEYRLKEMACLRTNINLEEPGKVTQPNQNLTWRNLVRLSSPTRINLEESDKVTHPNQDENCCAMTFGGD